MTITPEAVKPLEWRKGYCDEVVTITQASFGGLYQIRELNGEIWVDWPDRRASIQCSSVEEAQSAIQADHAQRILSALAEPPAQKPVAWMRTEKRWHMERANRQDVTLDPDLAEMWVDNPSTERVTPLFAGQQPAPAQDAYAIADKLNADLEPDDLFKVATALAANIGYELHPEPEHPDTPNRSKQAPTVAVDDDGDLAKRFAYLSERLSKIETLPAVCDLYYPIKNEGEGTGWNYSVSYVTASDIHAAASVLRARAEQREEPGEAVGEGLAENHMQTLRDLRDRYEDSSEGDALIEVLRILAAAPEKGER